MPTEKPLTVERIASYMGRASDEYFSQGGNWTKSEMRTYFEGKSSELVSLVKQYHKEQLAMKPDYTLGDAKLDVVEALKKDAKEDLGMFTGSQTQSFYDALIHNIDLSLGHVAKASKSSSSKER